MNTDIPSNNPKHLNESDLLRAIEPVIAWYQSDEQEDRIPLDIVRDIVSDLQVDRRAALIALSSVDEALELCYQIERCGASEALTKASVMASNLYTKLNSIREINHKSQSNPQPHLNESDLLYKALELCRNIQSCARLDTAKIIASELNATLAFTIDAIASHKKNTALGEDAKDRAEDSEKEKADADTSYRIVDCIRTLQNAIARRSRKIELLDSQLGVFNSMVAILDPRRSCHGGNAMSYGESEDDMLMGLADRTIRLINESSNDISEAKQDTRDTGSW